MTNFNRSRIALAVLLAAIALVMRFYSLVGAESNLLLNLHSISNDSLDHLMLNVNAIGGPKPVICFSVLFALLVYKGNKREAIMIPLVVGISGVINIALRAAFHWPRPELWHTLIYDHSYIYSFPSGHACLSASVATAVNLALAKSPYQRLALVGGTLYCSIVATTTLFLGVHYPLDVVGGWISGYLIVSILWSLGEAILRRLDRRDAPGSLNQVQADEQSS